MSLGFLPGGMGSRATGISADGTVVVGWSGSDIGDQAFLWTEASGMVGLGFLPGGMRSYATGVSADGTVVVGTSESDIGNQAFRWTEAGGMVGLGFLPGGMRSGATGVSADGTVVVGWSESEIGDQAFRWTEAGGMVGLGYLYESHEDSVANGISGNGAVIVGLSSYTSPYYDENFGNETIKHGFRWTEAGGMEKITGGARTYGQVAYGVSGDGTVVVGAVETTGSDGYFSEPYRWTMSYGLEELGNLNTSNFGRANGVSADGTVIVGYSGAHAFRWTEAVDMQYIDGVLSSNGVDLTGWRLASAAATNEDGSIIVGYGNNPSGNTEAWISDLADIPVPTSPIDLSGSLKTDYDADICAMVLANGKYMFSCNSSGEFSLKDIPRTADGTVKRQIYADGFLPKINTFGNSAHEEVVMTHSGDCSNYNILYEPAFAPGSAGKRINISGKVLLQDGQTPICAMVLANGQYVFSCDGTGTYFLKIPLDSNGQFKLQVYADGFAPSIRKFDEFKTTNIVRMARSVECQ